MLLWPLEVVRFELLGVGVLYHNSLLFPFLSVGQRSMDLLYGLMLFTESQ